MERTSTSVSIYPNTTMAELATLSNEIQPPALNPQVDFVTESYKINWFGQQRLGVLVYRSCALFGPFPKCVRRQSTMGDFVS